MVCGCKSAKFVCEKVPVANRWLARVSGGLRKREQNTKTTESEIN